MSDSEWGEILFVLVDEMCAHYSKVKNQALLFKKFYEGFPAQSSEDALRECDSMEPRRRTMQIKPEYLES